MKKVKTPQCDLCLESLENQLHFALQCGALREIRSQYMTKFIAACPNITQYISNQQILFLAILDPFSPLLPEDIRGGWKSSNEIYELSRNYFYDLHKKREKIIETTSNKETLPENEDVTDIIISVYENI